MTDELLDYYKQELEYFRLVAPEFARAHQAIAGRLRMSEEEIDDPHVLRLIQACAFLNARTRRKIDDDFPEISQALLQVLYPHYVVPFPSAAILRFALPEDQSALVQGFSIPRGATLETEPIDGDPCRFRTCYPVTVWPLALRRAGVHRAMPLPATRWSGATMPTLVMDGGKSPAWMRNATRALAGVLPNATYRTLDGQTHMVKPKALTPPLVEFFGRNAPTPA